MKSGNFKCRDFSEPIHRRVEHENHHGPPTVRHEVNHEGGATLAKVCWPSSQQAVVQVDGDGKRTLTCDAPNHVNQQHENDNTGNHDTSGMQGDSSAPAEMGNPDTSGMSGDSPPPAEMGNPDTSEMTGGSPVEASAEPLRQQRRRLSQLDTQLPGGGFVSCS
jgi:hypothetical protein